MRSRIFQGWKTAQEEKDKFSRIGKLEIFGYFYIRGKNIIFFFYSNNINP